MYVYVSRALSFTAKNEYHEDHVQVRNVTREKHVHHCNQGRDIQ